jgi:outer membrane protein
MRTEPNNLNPLIVCLIAASAVLPGLARAAAQTPTQAAPATQTTTPSPAPVPSTPLPQAPAAGPGPAASDAPQGPAAAGANPAGGLLVSPTTSGGAPQPAPQPGLPSGPQAAPHGGVLPNEPAELTPAQILGVALLPGEAASGGPAITYTEALTRARINEPVFATAIAAAKNAQLEKRIVRAGALPKLVAHNQYLYTQSAGLNTNAGAGIMGPAPRFIANNAVHEYVTQASATETIGLANYFEISRANALASIAKAQLEISRRGLNSTVTSLFYAASTTLGKVAIQKRALAEAEGFLKLTRDRETAREVAHADVLKAELTAQQRQRDVADARLVAEKAKLDLAVLLFPDPGTAYTVVLPAEVAPPEIADVQAQTVAAKSPQIASAEASLAAQTYALGTAQTAYLPELSLNYSYGIDAANYGIHAPDGNRNLGYSASATLDLPIFDWFATPNRIRQANNLRDASKVTLSAARRIQTVQIREFYNEVQTAYAQLDSLKQSVATAQESLHLTRLRYTAGEATVLEVTDAENTLATTETGLNDGTTRYQLALANLQILTGTI